MKRKLSVLIVDDNPNYLQRMISLLSEVDYISSIHTAQNYDEAFLLLNKKPDLALLDIHLPGKNGMHLLKCIKDSGNDCEVFMVTNSTGEYYREQCMKLGALCFFDKTRDFELVPGMIKDMAVHYNKKPTLKYQYAANAIRR
jgi:DNA-binding NarL/FixJ family response regulator